MTKLTIKKHMTKEFKNNRTKQRLKQLLVTFHSMKDSGKKITSLKID